LFDIIIKIGNNTAFKDPYKNNVFYKDKKYEVFTKQVDSLNLIGLYRGNSDNCIFENNKTLILILGSVFFKKEFSKNTTKSLSPEKIYKLSENKSDFLEKIKGDFTIIIYNKEKRALKVINDHFALRPFYYGKLNGDLIIANNLNHYKSYNPSINEVCLLEKILFTYPINDETFFQNILFLNGGEILTCRNKNFSISKYFDLEDFVFNVKNKKFDHKKFTEIFNSSVLQKASLSKNIVASLTGGFDGRAVISTLLKENLNFSTYSFGRENGENTFIPQKIKKYLGINYEPIYLNDQYEKCYTIFAKEAIYFSDGLSFHERANYTYAFHELSKKTNHVITGLIAGEILRPIHLHTDYMNELYYRIFYLNEEFDINQYLKDAGLYSFIKNDFIERNKKKLKNIIERKHKDILNNKKKNNGFLYYYYDLINLGFRRFYGSEMHLERFYATTLTPFFDYDILSYILNTNYNTLFKNAFKDNPIYRWKGQKIYAEVYRNNFPELGKIAVDRGYRPEYLLNIFKRFLIPFIFFKRKKKIKNSPSEFDSPKWSGIFFNELQQQKFPTTSLFINTDEVMKYIKNYNSENYNKNFNRLLGLLYWISN